MKCGVRDEQSRAVGENVAVLDFNTTFVWQEYIKSHGRHVVIACYVSALRFIIGKADSGRSVEMTIIINHYVQYTITQVSYFLKL